MRLREPEPTATAVCVRPILQKRTTVADVIVPPLPPDIRLFATDLDGTLLLPDGTVGERTRLAIDALSDAGVRVVFVTGRPPRWVHPVADMTDHRGTAIGANGGVTINMADDIITLVRPIPPDSALAAVNALRAITPDIDFAVEYATEGRSTAESFFAIGRTYTPRWEVPAHTEVGDVELLVNRPGITKLLGRPGGAHNHDADSFLEAADQALLGIVEVTHSNSDDVLLEMSGLGVTKGSTLEILAAQWGISAEHVVAVGDMPNDIPMLRWAAMSFAVSDAHPAAREAANAVIGSNADEAVAQLIEAVLAAR